VAAVGVVVARKLPPPSIHVRELRSPAAEKMELPETVRLVEVASVARNLVAKREVEVALVEVLVSMSRLVMVDDAELTKTPSPAVAGERKSPPSVQLELPPPPPIHVPFTAQQPPVRLTPLAKLDVAADEEKRALEMVVEALVMERSVVVAYASEVEPIENTPEADVRDQCLRLVPAPMSVRTSCGLNVALADVLASWRSQLGVVVPMPTACAKDEVTPTAVAWNFSALRVSLAIVNPPPLVSVFPSDQKAMRVEAPEPSTYPASLAM